MNTILNYQEIDAWQIDEMVYRLDVLTLEEIANVEGMQGIAYIL